MNSGTPARPIEGVELSQGYVGADGTLVGIEREAMDPDERVQYLLWAKPHSGKMVHVGSAECDLHETSEAWKAYLDVEQVGDDDLSAVESKDLLKQVHRSLPDAGVLERKARRDALAEAAARGTGQGVAR